MQISLAVLIPTPTHSIGKILCFVQYLPSLVLLQVKASQVGRVVGEVWGYPSVPNTQEIPSSKTLLETGYRE